MLLCIDAEQMDNHMRNLANIDGSEGWVALSQQAMKARKFGVKVQGWYMGCPDILYC
jgi:hypothetical protein